MRLLWENGHTILDCKNWEEWRVAHLNIYLMTENFMEQMVNNKDKLETINGEEDRGNCRYAVDDGDDSESALRAIRCLVRVLKGVTLVKKLLDTTAS